jgi:putative SOS response-associated peptidase YedK
VVSDRQANRRRAERKQRLREGRWRLVPWWAKVMPRKAMFNARIVTADSSGAFKDAFASTRCLMPADGFFEWTNGEDGGRDPWNVFLPGPQAFTFAWLLAYKRSST